MLKEYLQLLQESIPTKWRKRVEVFILKGDKLVVGYKREEDRYQSPGGGIETGQTMEQAAINECLEEIAVKINDPILINKKPYRVDWYELDKKGLELNPKVRERMKKYRGSEIYFMKADYDKVDKSRYGRAKDKMKPVVMTKERFIKELSKDDKMVINKFRIEMLRTL